jgi:TonB family protein
MKNSSPRAVARVAAVVAVVLALPLSLADEPEPRVTHILDTSTDRTPAKTAFPKYPRIARRDRIEGDATVCFRIDKFGRIRDARIRHATHKIFKRPALRAIKASQFESLAPNQVLASGRTCRTYRFRLEPILLAAEE